MRSKTYIKNKCLKCGKHKSDCQNIRCVSKGMFTGGGHKFK